METTMRKPSAIAAALIAVNSPAYAESGLGFSYWQRNFTSLSASPRAAEGVVDSPNTCAPDRAEPKWSATSSLLGYVCSSFSANGG